MNYKKMTLEELIIHSQQKDFKALEEVIRREQKNVYTTFSYLFKKKENVSDLTQEALLRVAKNIHTLKEPKCFKSWLNHIISNLYYDQVRKSGKNPCIVSLDNIECETQIADNKCYPIEKCITGELLNNIKKAILDLPEPFKLAIILRELQGLTYEQIAIATDTNVGTVKSRIARARNKLQCELKSYI